METVQEVLNDATAKIGKSFDALKAQFAGLRTGKASPAMVDQIKVDYYGAPTPIKNLGTISTPEPRQIKITPFDPTTIDGIMKAILAANLGVTPQSDGKVVRITVPALNEERRKEFSAEPYLRSDMHKSGFLEDHIEHTYPKNSLPTVGAATIKQWQTARDFDFKMEKMFMPIPEDEILKNPACDQNPGY